MLQEKNKLNHIIVWLDVELFKRNVVIILLDVAIKKNNNDINTKKTAVIY